MAIVSIPDMGDGVSWRGADSPHRAGPALGDRQPGVWLSVTTCPEINVRAGWPAVVTPPSAPRSLMGRGQVRRMKELALFRTNTSGRLT